MARSHQRLGITGLAGLLLVGASAASLALDLLAHPGTPQATGELKLQLPAKPAHPSPLPRFSNIADSLAVLEQIEHTALADGLGWPRAHYRIENADGEMPASLGLQLEFAAPYLAVRKFATDVLARVPGATLREFTISRESTDAPTVTAKVGIVVLFADTAESGLNQQGRPR